MISDKACIGPFFYINGNFTAHKIPVPQGEARGNKIDNPYSHEKLYDSEIGVGDYINVPRGRVVWDSETDKVIIYIDSCIEKIDGAIIQIVELFGLTDYIVEHDGHYVCPNCMENIWEDS